MSSYYVVFPPPAPPNTPVEKQIPIIGRRPR